jgi:hypothetical protein
MKKRKILRILKKKKRFQIVSILTIWHQSEPEDR